MCKHLSLKLNTLPAGVCHMVLKFMISSCTQMIELARSLCTLPETLFVVLLSTRMFQWFHTSLKILVKVAWLIFYQCNFFLLWILFLGRMIEKISHWSEQKFVILFKLFVCIVYNKKNFPFQVLNRAARCRREHPR